MNKIAVIMPSYLGDYPGAGTNRVSKFLRAVDSFIDQPYQEKRLIIVADGCDKTWKLYENRYKKNPSIFCITIPKQPVFSGKVRQAGIDYINKTWNPDIIAPLDNDDYLLPYHLDNIELFMADNDFIYSNEFYMVKKSQVGGSDDTFVLADHPVFLQKNVSGTSSVVWRNKPEFSWKDLDGWGHDWKFIERLKQFSIKYTKVDRLGYVICHVKGFIDN